MWHPAETLPSTRAIFLVRKWVAKNDQSALSFIARSPEAHIKAFGVGHLELEPDVGVVVGCVRDGEFVDEHGYADEGFDVSAILAWTPIPSEFATERECAAHHAADVIARAAR